MPHLQQPQIGAREFRQKSIQTIVKLQHAILHEAHNRCGGRKRLRQRGQIVDGIERRLRRIVTRGEPPNRLAADHLFLELHEKHGARKDPFRYPRFHDVYNGVHTRGRGLRGDVSHYSARQ